MDVGYQFGRTGELRIGYEGGWEKFASDRSETRTSCQIFPAASGACQNAVQLDRLDNAVIPRQGQAAQVDFLWSNTSPLATNQYPCIGGQIRQNFFRLNEPSSVFLKGYAGTTFNNETGLPQFSPGRFTASGCIRHQRTADG